jgi:Ca-activated chloride channel homolog
VDLYPAVQRADPENLLGCTAFQTARWYPPLLQTGMRVDGVFVRTLVSALCVTAVVGFAATVCAQEPSLPTFKSSVNLVPISAVVHDRKGRPVGALKAADFEVFDKGERRRILDFQVDRTNPLSLALLIDASGSMVMGPRLPFARKVVEHIVADLAEGRDEVGLFTFDQDLHEEQSFTYHPTGIDRAVGSVEPFGTTSLYDAIAATARRFDARSSARRAIVVFTDGLDTSSKLTPGEVSALASSIDVPVYIVVTVSPIDYAQHLDRETSGVPQARGDLRDLAQWTGGDLLWATATESAGLRAFQILSELRHQYLIAIEAADDSNWRPLDVRVRDRKLTVRARSGYFNREASPNGRSEK